RGGGSDAVGDPAAAGHLDVEQAHLGPVGPCRLDHLVGAADLGDDVEVALQRQQGRQGTADEGLVVGQQDPDPAHVQHTSSRVPPAGTSSTVSVPPAARTPSSMPRRRWPTGPSPRPWPSSVTPNLSTTNPPTDADAWPR